jgi:hypothetical protein
MEGFQHDFLFLPGRFRVPENGLSLRDYAIGTRLPHAKRFLHALGVFPQLAELGFTVSLVEARA